MKSALIFALNVLFGSQALGCPLCYTETAEQVRAGIFNQGFFSNLGPILLPFVVFAVISLGLYHRWPWEKKDENCS